jgi:division protein CdvB (Snf7/Vps24/ESCRT-III family)
MVATYKISGILKQSTGVMRDVNSLVKIPELNRDMRQFSMELTKVSHSFHGTEVMVGGYYRRDDG